MENGFRGGVMKRFGLLIRALVLISGLIIIPLYATAEGESRFCSKALTTERSLLIDVSDLESDSRVPKAPEEKRYGLATIS